MTLQTMLARLARSQSELDWDEWYVLALAAHKEPDQWRGAWERLDADDREALLTRLHNDAGPLADHVIRSILPRELTELDDPTLELAHEDAAAATARQLERLKRIGRRAELDTGEARAALEAHIDIESLRQEAERLRAQAARDPELAERNALEKEITRLKALMSTLQAYDWKAREAEQRRLAGDTEALKAAAATAAASLSPSSVTVTYETKSPAVSDADAQSVADQANGWISQDVTVTAPAGKAGVAGESTTVEESTYTAEDTAKASWITVTTSESEAPTIGVDSGRVSEWVAAQVKDVNEEPVTGKRNVNSQGKEVAVSVEAVDGREVTNADAISDAIVQALSSGKPYSGTFETKEIKATWEERKIAAGAENLAYQATDGEKWIDINLSNKTVTAYEGATVVHGPVSVVDGAAATPTVTGTYHVYLQYESQTMRGENADGSNYVTEGVPWITYFYQGYALHGAPWRSSFGYSASHGCLNMPVGEAQWFFNWAEVGTTVASHY